MSDIYSTISIILNVHILNNSIKMYDMIGLKHKVQLYIGIGDVEVQRLILQKHFL